MVAATVGHEGASYGHGATMIAAGGGGVLFLAPLLMIVFRQKYPRWWYDWNLELLRFTNRIGAYLALMDDRYPSTDEHQAVALDSPIQTQSRDSTAGSLRGRPPISRVSHLCGQYT